MRIVLRFGHDHAWCSVSQINYDTDIPHLIPNDCKLCCTSVDQNAKARDRSHTKKRVTARQVKMSEQIVHEKWSMADVDDAFFIDRSRQKRSCN